MCIRDSSHISINTVDIGLAQLAMHSPYETAGTKDALGVLEGVNAFYKTKERFIRDRDLQDHSGQAKGTGKIRKGGI